MTYSLQSNVIFRISETVKSSWSCHEDASDDDYNDVHTNEYLVSIRILRDWMNDNEGEYRYIARVITAALAGTVGFDASAKFSFYDCPEWYTALHPDRDCDDPIVDFHYTVYK